MKGSEPELRWLILLIASSLFIAGKNSFLIYYLPQNSLKDLTHSSKNCNLIKVYQSLNNFINRLFEDDFCSFNILIV